MFSGSQDAIDRLILEDEGDRKVLAEAEHKLEKARAKVCELIAQAEIAAARVRAYEMFPIGSTPSDFIFREEETLRIREVIEIESKIRQMFDPLIEDRDKNKQAIFQRNSRLAGEFGSWAWSVIQTLPAGHPMVVSLELARQNIDREYSTATVRAIVEKIVPLVEIVEADETIPAPLFRLNRLARELTRSTK